MDRQLSRNSLSAQLLERVHISDFRMFDSQHLEAWVQPHHLSAAAMRGYSDAFRSHPASILVLHDFLIPEVAEKLSHFLINEAQYEKLYGLYSAMQASPNGIANVTEEQWLNASEKDKFFKLNKCVGVSPKLRLTQSLVTYLKFQAAFDGPKFRQFFESLSNLCLSYEKTTFHSFAMTREDCLGWHHDDNNKYRLAFIFYLSPGWKPGFGGVLQMVDPQGEVTSIHPEFNRLVLFEVKKTTKHRITAIEEIAGDRVRATISGWVHKPGAEGSSALRT